MTDIIDRIATRLGPLASKVTIRELVAGDARTIVVLADIGPEAIAPPRVALTWAARMGSGAIALVDDRYVVRFAVPIDQVDTAPWVQVVGYASRLATELATHLHSARRPADVTSLSHYGD